VSKEKPIIVYGLDGKQRFPVPSKRDELREAAQAVVYRWDTPESGGNGDAPVSTEMLIARLRAVLNGGE
jgi:hypothetical protein